MSSTPFQVARTRVHGGPAYHVHGPNCGDARKQRYVETETVTAATLTEIAAEIYGVNDGAEYTCDFKVFPCAGELAR